MVSEEAALVIVGVVPIRLMAKQRKLVYDNKERIGMINPTKDARDIVLDAWQDDFIVFMTVSTEGDEHLVDYKMIKVAR